MGLISQNLPLLPPLRGIKLATLISNFISPARYHCCHQRINSSQR